MNSQPEQVPHLPTQAGFSRSASKRSHIPTEVRGYVSRRRHWLTAGAVLLLLVMCAGIVFAAHHYYISFGGQGFLKVRYQYATPPPAIDNAPRLFLPLRKIATFGDHSALEWSRRSPMEVPYMACGDQQASCEAFGQQDLCCPVKMTCHPTPLTLSNIYCCSSNETTLDCDSSWIDLPICLPTLFECLGLEGGGCCPTDTLCSPNGCIKITGPTTIGASTAVTTTPTGPVTVTEVPVATATIMKQGEVVRSGVGQNDSVVLTLCLPYLCTAILVFIAALMGFL